MRLAPVLKKGSPFSERIEKLREDLARENLDACLVESPVDLYYLTGLSLSSGKLVVTPDGGHLFVDGRYLQIAHASAPVPAEKDAKEAVSAKIRGKRVGFDAGRTSHSQFLRLSEYSALEWVVATSLFDRLRLIKDDFEIGQMQKSAALLWKGYEWILSALKVGVTEHAVSKGFEIFCLENGADGLAFEPIIAFGENSAMPHYRSQKVPLSKGDTVLIDIGVVREKYHSDMTRVHFFQGTDAELERLYAIAKESQKAALAHCKPGVRVGMLDEAARSVMQRENVEELFVHSLGHGIGLETHEFPRIRYDGAAKDVLLETGMVITVEPGLYIPGKGGVRYEDTVVVTANGYDNFYPESEK